MSEVGTALTDTVKGSMRISSKSAVVENDINNTIAAAKMDLKAAGVKKNRRNRPAHYPGSYPLRKGRYELSEPGRTVQAEL